ncbi:MAG: ribosomal protein L7/L12 [Bacteroidetes bacterium]|nr:ribosomal protein L7/L12 [Bacteroidota bacterium]
MQQHPIPPAAAAELESGRTIEAIKIVRQTHGLGLKESKDLVDEYLRSRPDLAARAAQVRTESNKKALVRLLLGLVVGFLIYRILSAL